MHLLLFLSVDISSAERLQPASRFELLPLHRAVYILPSCVLFCTVYNKEDRFPLRAPETCLFLSPSVFWLFT